MKTKHNFKLSGMDLNDWFMGCERCWYQRPKNEAGYRKCPKCENTLTVHKIQLSDIIWG